MKSSQTAIRRWGYSLVTVCVALAVILVCVQTASACPSCKVALANQQGKGDLVSGFFYSIMFMLSMPFAIFGSFSGYFYYLVRRAQRQQQESSGQLKPDVRDGKNVGA